MAAELVLKIYGEVTGQGNDKVITCRATASDVPTLAGGPFVQVLTTAPLPVKLGSVVSGQLIALFVKALTSHVSFLPTISTPLASCACYIPEGQTNFVTYQTATSVIPWVFGNVAGTVAKAEILYVAVS